MKCFRNVAAIDKIALQGCQYTRMVTSTSGISRVFAKLRVGWRHLPALKMASRQAAFAESSLMMPAVEIVDLLSDEGSDDEAQQPLDRDALSKEGESEEDDEEEQWESESLYEDALEGLGDEHLTGDGKRISRAQTSHWENTC